MWANTDFLFRGEKMGREMHQSIVIDVKATLDGMNEVVGKLNKGLREGATKVDLTKGIGSSLSKYIDKFKDEYSKFTKLTEGGKVDFADSKEAIKSGEAIIKTFKEMQRVVGDFKDLSVVDAKKLFPEAFDSRVGELQKGLSGLYNAMNKLESKNLELKTAKDALTELTTDAARFKEVIDSEAKLKVDLDTATAGLQTVEEKVEAIRAKAAEGITLKINAGEAKITEAQTQLQQIQEARQTRGFKAEAFSKTSSGVLQFEGQSEANWTKVTKSASASDADKAKAQAAIENIRLYKQEEEAIKSLNQTISSEGAQVDNLKKKLVGFDKVKLSEAVRLGGGTAKDITNANKAMEELADATSQANTTQGLYNTKTKEVKEAKAAYERTTDAIEAQQAKIEKINLEIGQLNKEVGTVELTKAFETAGIEGFSAEMLKTKDGLTELKAKLDEADAKSLERLKQELSNIGLSADQADKYVDELRKSLGSVDDTSKDIARSAKEIENLKNQVLQFFSMSNAVQLFKRTVTSAINTVKELDSVMTEAAVVTEFSVGDMWDKLPEYTKNANQLGVATKELYGATTLYYQQGLKSNEAMELGVETMKMAKIAGLASTDATKAMTAALRGFNMELNEMSATRVNDVYSQLAAVTAADVSQISTAMEKTASIAASANMEFETTAALLAQIIETTQEAPETAGTAMKTIIARFSEVKTLVSQGQISGMDSEGQEIDINKIQVALGQVGISMSDFFAGTEGLDSVLLKLAEKWDTLDFSTQRYIATTAAGSRQQSRFIAMMSNYQRTTELVTQANNSAGASQRQFEKTTESLEYKLTQLKNAWDSFTMSLANNEVIKFGVDLLTSVLDTVNNLTEALSGGNGLIKSVISLGVALGGLKLGKAALGGGLGFIGEQLGLQKEREDKSFKEKAGDAWGFVSGKTAGKKQYKARKEATQSGLEKIRKDKEERQRKLDEKKEELKKAKHRTNFGKGNDAQKKKEQNETEKARLTKEIEKEEKALDKLNQKEQKLTDTDEKYANSQKKIAQGMHLVGESVIVVGSAIMGLASILYENNAISKDTYETMTQVGGIIAGVGAAITVLTPIVQGFTNMLVSGGIKTQAAWWPLLLIGLALGAIVGIIYAVVKSGNTLEKQLEKQQEATQRASQAAEDAAASYDGFVNSLDRLEAIENKFDGLIRGTKEWDEAIKENNEEVMALIDTYDGLAEHVKFDADGKMIIDKEILEEKKKQLEDAKQNTAMGAKVSKAKEYDIQNDIILRKFKTNTQKNLVRALARDETLIHDEKRLAELGFTKGQITEEMEDAAREISLNMVQQDQLMKQSIMAGVSQEAAQSQYANRVIDITSKDAVGDGVADRVEEISSGLIATSSDGKNLTDQSEEFQQLMRDEGVARTGNNLTDLQNLYMAMSGKNSLDEIDEDIRTDEKALLQAIAEMKAGDEQVEATEKLIKSLDNMSEEVAELTLLGLGQEATGETKLDTAMKLSNMGFHEYLRTTGMSEDEYARRTTGGPSMDLYSAGVHYENMSNSRKISFLQQLVDAGYLGDLTEDAKVAIASAKKGDFSQIDNYLYGNGKEWAGLFRGYYTGKGEEDKTRFVLPNGQVLTFGDKIGTSAEAYYNNNKEKNDVMQSYEDAFQEIFRDSRHHLSAEQIARGYSGLSINQMNKIIEQMSSDYATSAWDWTGIIKKLRTENPDKLDSTLTYLQSVDWSDSSQALAAMSWMKEQGYSDEIINEYWQEATDAVEKYANGIEQAIKLGEQFRKEYTNSNELRDRLEDGEASDEDVLKMINSGVATWEDFSMTYDGWKYVGDDIEEATQKLKEFHKIQLELQRDQLKSDLEKANSYYAKFRSSNMSGLIKNDKGQYEIFDFAVDNFTELIKERILEAGIITAEEARYLTKDQIRGILQEQANLLNTGDAQLKITEKSLEFINTGLDSDYKSSLDKQFNLYEKINAELRKREKLERAYQRLLESENVSGQELSENLQKRLASLEKTATTQDDLKKAKEQEIKDYRKENAKFSSYYSYDQETGAIKLLKDPTTAFKNAPTKGKAFDDFINELQSKVNQRNEAEDEAENAKDERSEIKKELRESTKQFRTSIKDAILADRQKQIDKLTEINDSIQDTNSRLIQSMQESLDKQRQERDNAKTEEDLADKQRRLAYLQQDTSGANATEILKLQKEIEEGQESYTDKLIDQKISELQKQNDKAAEQRQEQIEIMTAQLEAYESSGAVWDDVTKKIEEGMTAGGTIKAGSELESLIKNSPEFKAMDDLERQDYMQEMATQLAQTFSWLKLFSGSSITPYATGGLADFTGPAWLDGTKSRPEYVLNASQTEAFFSLVDVLESLKFGSTKTTQNNGDNTFDIDITVEKIDGDYDVEQMAEKIKTLIVDSSRYRNNNTL